MLPMIGSSVLSMMRLKWKTAHGGSGMIPAHRLCSDDVCPHCWEYRQPDHSLTKARVSFALTLIVLALHLAQTVVAASQRTGTPTAYLFVSSACQACDRSIRTCRRAEIRLRSRLQVHIYSMTYSKPVISISCEGSFQHMA